MPHCIVVMPADSKEAYHTDWSDPLEAIDNVTKMAIQGRMCLSWIAWSYHFDYNIDNEMIKTRLEGLAKILIKSYKDTVVQRRPVIQRLGLSELKRMVKPIQVWHLEGKGSSGYGLFYARPR